jgi:spore germination cell wall hydrolase CwlJ-like protein
MLPLFLIVPAREASEYPTLPRFSVKMEVVTSMPAIVEDWQWVVMTAIQEAALESLKGKIMVCEVIRDRAEKHFNCDGTIVSAVLSPNQFSGWNTNDRSRINAATLDLSNPRVRDTIEAYNIAFKSRSNYAMGANLYHADYMNPYPEWTKSAKVKRLTQEGHHIFYFESR